MGMLQGSKCSHEYGDHFPLCPSASAGHPRQGSSGERGLLSPCLGVPAQAGSMQHGEDEATTLLTPPCVPRASWHSQP